MKAESEEIENAQADLVDLGLCLGTSQGPQDIFKSEG